MRYGKGLGGLPSIALMAVAILLGTCLPGNTLLGQGVISAPQPQFRDNRVLQIIEEEILAGRFTEAGERVAELVIAHAPELMTDDEGNLVTVGNWAAQLLDQHPTVLPAYRKATDASVQYALRTIAAERTHRHEALYAITSMFPRSRLEDTILLAAAERALQFGDPVSAYFYLKQRSTPTPSSDWLSAVELAVDSLETAPSPGLHPFNAPWYSTVDGFTKPKSLPVTAGSWTFITGPSQLLALDKDGQINWTAHDGGGDSGMNNLISRSGRGIIYEPAIATDVIGQPQVVIVRQTAARSQRLVLRAFSAASGEMLWSTEHLGRFAQTEFLGNPTVTSGQVYTVGLTQTASGSHLALIALELGTGHLLWETPLGSVTYPRADAAGQSTATLDPKPIWQQSPPAIAGHRILIAPGNGIVASLDRFSGAVHWMGRYDRIPDPSPEQWQRWLGGRYPPQDVFPTHHLMRFRTTPYVHDDIVVIGPADSRWTLAFDLRTGRQLWAEQLPAAPILIGGSDETIVLAGDRVVALDLRTGNERWQFHPREEQAIAGAPVVHNGLVLVPLNSRLMVLSVTDGKPAVQSLELPPMRRFLALERVKRALKAAQLAEAFDLSED